MCITTFAITLTAGLVTIAVSLNVVSNKNVSDFNDVNSVRSNREELGKHCVFSKKEWGGKASLLCDKPLYHPTEYVIISHTGGRVCKNFFECSELMQQIQAQWSTQHSDIGQNFLIGGDGNIYVGRGWDIQNSYRDNSIVIGFTGNFAFDCLKPNMIAGLKQLLEQGVKLKKLKPGYKLVCHNQTYHTLSPGRNVYNVISKFSHFCPGRVEID